MKKIIAFILYAALTIGLVACDQSEPVESSPETSPVETTPVETIPTEPDVNLFDVNYHNDVYYQIFVRSFADSDGDGIGDLDGITENLDYLEDLGVTALWLMPIHPSPSYHGYNVTDYYGINPDYGTMTDFEELIDAAAERGINIMIDFVINHTSDQHPWYIDAASSTSSPYRDYYIWNGSTAYETFVGGMKDLNFNNPEVIDEIKDIMDFYLEKGVLGFRVDAAVHLFEGLNSDINNQIVLAELNRHIKANYPESFITTETYRFDYVTLTDYYIGADSTLDFYIAQNIWEKVGGGNSRSYLVSNIRKAYESYKTIRPDFVSTPFIGNHDLDRLASQGYYLGPTGIDKLKLSNAVLLTLPGSPIIYYGDEIAMKGVRYEGTNIPGYGVVYDEYRRQPFLWGSSDYQTTWLPSDGSNDLTSPVSDQMMDQTSMWNFIHTMIELRKAHPALMFGNSFEAYEGNSTYLQGYVRHYQYEDIEEAVLVIHNLSQNSITVDHPYLELIYGDDLTLDAYDTLILKIDPTLIEDYT